MNDMIKRREQTRTIVDQVYSHAGGVARLADVYLPGESATALPVVIWLHGGGWRFGDRRMAPDLARFAQQSGMAVVSIDYRLSDEAHFPAAVLDVKTAVRWTRRVADQFGFAADSIGLWGSSAGGHLAACAALSAEDEFVTEEHAGYSSAVQAVVDGYGPTNFGRIDADRQLSALPGKDAESLGIGKVLPAGHPDSFESRFLGSAVSESPAIVEIADPVHYVRSGAPPFLILHGGADTLIPSSQSRYLFDALAAANNDAWLLLFEKLGHGFFNNRELAEADYGTVTANATPTQRQDRWSCDSSMDIPSIVLSFFQAHLCAQRHRA
jgi:acetyl esterase/lipase